MEAEAADRFLSLLGELGYHTQQQIADMLEVSRPKAGTLVRKENMPSFDDLSRLCRLHPEVNMDWLFNGRGDKYVTGNTKPVATKQPAPAPKLSADPGEIAELKQQREDWKQEAQTWKELYLSSIGKGELAGKLQPDNYAAETARLLAGFGEGRGARVPQSTTMMVDGRVYTFAEVASLNLSNAQPALVIGEPTERIAV